MNLELSKWQDKLLRLEPGTHIVIDQDKDSYSDGYSRIDLMKAIHRGGYGCMIPPVCKTTDDILAYVVSCDTPKNLYVLGIDPMLYVDSDIWKKLDILESGVLYSPKIPGRMRLIYNVRVIVLVYKVSSELENCQKVWKVIGDDLVPYTGQK